MIENITGCKLQVSGNLTPYTLSLIPFIDLYQPTSLYTDLQRAAIKLLLFFATGSPCSAFQR